MPSVPLSLKGVRPEALETAREAARRAGMSVEDWLNSVIVDKAAETGVRPKRRYPRDDELEWQVPLSPTTDAAPKEAPKQAPKEDRDDQRKDRAEPVLDRVARPSAAGTSRSLGVGAPPASQALPASDALSRLDARLNQISAGRRAGGESERRVGAAERTAASRGRERPLSASSKPGSPLERAVAEITARQRELDGELEPRAQALLPELPLFANDAPPIRPDLSGLQDQIEQLTSRIESMRRPCAVEDSVKALRGDLADIARTLTEAMPRRAVEALENEVRSLAQRLADSRRSGADVAALAGIERGLAEVRIALCTLTPAEGLVAFQQAAKALSEKIDQIPATNRDPSALRQFEMSINSLRGVVANVASNEALAKVAEAVHELTTKVDRIAGSSGGGDVLVNLEKRISVLADTLQARAPAERTDLSQLESMVGRLTEKIDRLQEQRNDPAARGPLEERIIKLIEKVDASDARLGQLEVIERTLGDVLRHLDDLRTTNAAARQGAEAQAQAVVPVVDGLKRDIDSLRVSDRRTQDSLEAVHGALGDVVGRIATLETDLRGQQTAPPRAPASTFAAKQPPSAGERRPIDPSLPPHHPLEPGAGRGRGNAAERIAASEAVLANTSPVSPEPEPRSNFIAAARRAAQSAAASLREPNAGEPARSDAKSAGAVPIGQRLAKHVKSLLVGGSIVLLMIGSWHLAGALFDPADPADPALSGPGQLEPVKSSQARPRSGDQYSSGSAATRRAPPDQPSRLAPADDAPSAKTAKPDVTGSAAARPEAPPPAPPSIVVGASPSTAPAGASSSAIFTPGALLAAPQPKPGTPQFPLTPAAPENPGQLLASGADKLPAAIGGPGLRKAAAAGDPAAEYEVASRYADGRNVTQNIAEAARWYERAASHGLVPAVFRLGSLYEKGQGVGKDSEMARRLYTEAADKGHAKAMHNLAVLYAEGIDGRPDFKTAATWFRKAADHAVADSQYNLGILYARGIGVEQNLAESFKWFTLAAQQGDGDAAKKRDEVAARLDAQSLTAAKLAVQTWTADPQPDEAVTVKTPAGGWDGAGAEHKSNARHLPNPGL